MTAAPDRGLERYEVLERIAVGGMAEVFRARACGAHGFEKTIAIKRILPRLVRSEEFVKRFIAEAKLAVKLTHANIVQVLDFGRSADSLFIAMEYVDGPDLARLVDAYGEIDAVIPVGAAMHIAIELCKGLDFAHQRDVIHRDISHANILLSMAGEVKIADFGIAKAVGSGTSLTMSRRIMGKWRYMSPEQTAGERLDSRSDIFSTGVVLHELFTGRRLFAGRNIEDIVGKIRAMPVPPLSSVRSDLPDAVDTILARALARERDQRYATAAEMVHDLTEVCFAHRLVPTAMILADAIGQVESLAATDVNAAAPGADADAVIAAALGRADDASDVGRVTVALAPGASGPTRSPQRPTAPTVVAVPQARVAPAGTATSAPDAEVELPAPDLTSTTFIRGELDPDGLARWQLPDEAYPVPPVVGAPRRGGLLLLFVVFAGASVAIALLLPRVLAGATSAPDGAPLVAASDAAPAGSDAAIAPRHDARLSADAAPARVGFVVTTEPRAVEVVLDGEVLGLTPLNTEVVADGAGHRVELRRRGYQTVTVEVELLPGRGLDLERRLERTTRYGTIDIHAEPWANIYFRGRKVGVTPKRGLRLPVGRHRLELVNPVQGRKTSIVVDVPGSHPYKVTLP